jgi:hypothetical protein
MKDSNSSKRIREVLDPWNLSRQSADTLFEPTRNSLVEVSRLTQYLDEKAARVLTAVAFISALASTVYGVLWREVLSSHPDWLNLCFNLLFFTYGTLVAAGAFCVISGIFPRFNIPADWLRFGTRKTNPAVNARQSGLPESFLFGPQIVKSSPVDWAKAFVDHDPDTLKSAYVKDHIHETYLVAENIPYKLGWLWIGMRAIQIANLILVAWFILIGARVLFAK